MTGGATLVLLPLAWLIRHAFGLEDSEFTVSFVAFYLAYVINDPHFAVTYLLFYRGSLARKPTVRYLVAGIVVPILLVGWAIAALVLHSASALGWMVQLMFLLVGWHYTKQGFGVLSVLSARRGIRWSARERWIILAHCYAGWAFAWSNPSGPAATFEEKGVVYTALGHPRWIELATGGVLGVSTIAFIVMIVIRLFRGDRVPRAALTGLLITVWSWTIFSNIDPLLRYFIPALHSIQYLYFVWLMKRGEARAEEGPPSFGRPVAVRVGGLAIGALILGWVLFHGAPIYLDSMHLPTSGPIGPTPFFAALFVIVNIHHYCMDSVIWRRDNPDTRFLLA